MSKFDILEELVEQWHQGGGEGLSLREYLGLNEEEYLSFLLGVPWE
jgi:hypothetical protein